MSQLSPSDTKGISPVTLTLVGVAFLVVIPLVFFGGPGYYGDDLNLITALGEGGFAGALRQWFDHYGFGYRPLGISLDFILYGLFGDIPAAAYAINTAVFLCIALVIYRSMLGITGDEAVAVIVATFFALFPFGPTAYLQLSSFCMLVGILLVVPLAGIFLSLSQQYESWIGPWTISAIWGAVLLIYEQPVGLYAFFGIVLIAHFCLKPPAVQYKAVIKLCTTMTITTAAFLALYLIHPGNPKIVSLKTILGESVGIAAVGAASLGTPAGSESIVVPARPTAAAQPVVFDQSRMQKLVRFFIENIGYPIQNLRSKPSSLIAFFGVLALVAVGIFRIRVRIISQRMAARYVLLGTSWSFLTILPFFLYGRFTAPPYVFVLPSIGAGVASYGLYWLLLPAKLGASLRVGLLKILSVVVMGLFTLQQYGYFFGLKDELRYSRMLAERVATEKEEILRGVTIIVDGVPLRAHDHIFWLKKAVGNRAFISELGGAFSDIEVRESGVGTLKISIPHILSGQVESKLIVY